VHNYECPKPVKKVNPTRSVIAFWPGLQMCLSATLKSNIYAIEHYGFLNNLPGEVA
jgi:hypothetical protein